MYMKKASAVQWAYMMDPNWQNDAHASIQEDIGLYVYVWDLFKDVNSIGIEKDIWCFGGVCVLASKKVVLTISVAGTNLGPLYRLTGRVDRLVWSTETFDIV